MDQQARRDHHAFFGETDRIGRHRSGCLAADLRVMGAVRHEGDPPAGGVEHRRDQGDVGQMRAAEAGVVGDDDITRSGIEHPQHLPHADSERSEMHRHVRGAGDQAARGIEQRAGEIETFLHIRRQRGAAEQVAHRGDDAFEAAAEQRAPDRCRQGALLRDSFARSL